MRIGLFVEDAAHEAFVVSLARRVALDNGVDPQFDLRNALGGRGAVLQSLRRYVRDLARGRERFAEILVVGIDGNCQGSQAVKRAILDIAAGEEYPGLLVCAVPNPHIELWYLADGIAVHAVVGISGPQAGLPEQKCEKARYKTLLRQAFLDGSVDPPAGGSEYGAEIAQALDLGRASVANGELADFIADLGAAIRSLSASMG